VDIAILTKAFLTAVEYFYGLLRLFVTTSMPNWLIV